MGKIISNGITYGGGSSFTPVQQGGGIGQLTNKVCIGWSSSGLKVTVDATDLGALAFKSELGAYLPLSGGTMTNNILGSNGGQFATDGNVYINTGGWTDWLTNIINDHCYRSTSALFHTAGSLLINGNSLNSAMSQIAIEYAGSYFRFRNDGSATYFMNGNSNGWTNHASVDTAGNWRFNGGTQITSDNWVKASVLNSTYARDNTVSAAVNCYIDTAGTVSRTATTSSRRFKDDITLELNEDLNPHKLYDLDIVQFKYKKEHLNNEKDMRYYKDLIGLIAEDVYEKYPVAADYHIDEETDEVVVDAWNEQYMIPAMLKLIQDQKQDLDKKNDKIIELENRINSLEDQINKIINN